MTPMKASPLLGSGFAGLPPAYIFGAGHDRERGHGMALGTLFSEEAQAPQAPIFTAPGGAICQRSADRTVGRAEAVLSHMAGSPAVSLA